MARKGLRSAYAPSLETCEARLLMTGYNGINIGGNGGLSTSNMWVDIAKTFGAWGVSGKPYMANPSLALSAQGYPLADASTDTIDSGSPNGVYQLSYQGTASVRVTGTGSMIGLPVTGADGVTRVQVQLVHLGMNPINLTFTNINVADPPHDLHLIEPGYAVNTTQVFTNDFLHRLEPFSTLRVMELTATNWNSQVNWSDRTLPNNFLQTGPNGVAYEYVAALANASGKDVWINVPAQASDDFVTKLADLMRDQVHSTAKVYVEYGNENWNVGFGQYYQIRAVARVNPLITANSDSGKVAQESAYRLKQVGDIFRQEFGARSSQLNVVYGAFQGYSVWGQMGLDFVNSLYGDPSKYISGLAVGSYFQPTIDLNQVGVTLDQLFANLTTFISGSLTTSIKVNKALANKYHLALMTYEGGPAMVSSTHVGQPLIDAAQDDPRMGLMIQQFVAAWDKNGGGLGEFYKLIAPNAWSNDWGLLQTATQPGSVKYDAMMAAILPGGDATLDGTVGYDDFSILKSHFNQPGTFWWEQGDFNHDNTVNEGDLEILRSHLGAVTAQQASEIAFFNTSTTGVVGQPLTFNAGGANGAMTYSWSVFGGSSLAGGMVVNKGAFAFTPTAPGNYLIYLGITDASHHVTYSTRNVTIAGSSTLGGGGVRLLSGIGSSVVMTSGVSSLSGPATAIVPAGGANGAGNHVFMGPQRLSHAHPTFRPHPAASVAVHPHLTASVGVRPQVTQGLQDRKGAGIGIGMGIGV